MTTASAPPGFLTWSRGISGITGIDCLLGGPLQRVTPWRTPTRTRQPLVAWGHKPAARRARAFAQQHGLPFLALEDGFLRSVGFGPDVPTLSVVVDDMGIYYDARQASRLEQLITQPLTGPERVRAEALVRAWREGRVSKYNHAREHEGVLPQQYVLVVDQTAGDQSIEGGMASACSFQQMLDAALRHHPQGQVVVKVHPEVAAGRKAGHFDLTALRQHPRIQVMADDAHPVRLVQQARAVYVVTSQVGFEALIWGRPVYTFGMPFYAGWGLTHDVLPAPARRQDATGLQLVHACLVDYPRYRDPETGARCEVEVVLAHLALQRRERARFPAVVHALGFSPWKRPLVASFLQGSQVHFLNRSALPSNAACLAIWGRKPLQGDHRPGQTVLRLEDGFVRSVGLGADLTRPLSWVIDSVGIYFDRHQPSELENLLQRHAFDARLLARARALRETIVGRGLTKYNTASAAWQPGMPGQRLVLVAGQVENDASVQWGGAAVQTNRALLMAARQMCPGARLIYKPHPDVLAGLRPDSLTVADATVLCDELVLDASLPDLLQAVDEVHVLTSLTGFEALLRGKTVVCHGQPFYAGWGLTRDVGPVARRTRQLQLDELVAASLILYPRYISRTTGCFTTPERALDELLQWRGQPRPPLRLRRWLRRSGSWVAAAFRYLRPPPEVNA